MKYGILMPASGAKGYVSGDLFLTAFSIPTPLDTGRVRAAFLNDREKSPTKGTATRRARNQAVSGLVRRVHSDE